MERAREPIIPKKQPTIEAEQIPEFGKEGIVEWLEKYEKTWGVKTIEALLAWINNLIRSSIKYDGLNFLVGKTLHRNTYPNWPVDFESIDPNNILVLPDQVRIVKEWTDQKVKKFPDNDLFVEISEALNGLSEPYSLEQVGGVLDDFPSLVRMIAFDPELQTMLDRMYLEKNFNEQLKQGIWNCNTLSSLSKSIITEAAKRWNIPWVNIEYVRHKFVDHTYLKISYKGKSQYFDPSKPLLWSAIPSEKH